MRRTSLSSSYTRHMLEIPLIASLEVCYRQEHKLAEDGGDPRAQGQGHVGEEVQEESPLARMVGEEADAEAVPDEA